MPVETTIYSQPIGGGDPIEEFPAEIIKYTYRLNRPGSVEFSLSLDDAKTIAANIYPGEHEVVIRRNGAIVWCGPVIAASESEAGRTVQFGGEGLMAYLRKWHITSTLQTVNNPAPITGAVQIPQEQFEVARALIDHHQAKAGGDMGIDTSAATASGVLLDRTYLRWEVKNIFDALVQLAEVDNGFDFEINPASRALVMYYPKRGHRTEDIFDERNIREFSRDINAQEQASAIIGIGSGDAARQLQRTTQSSSAVARYGLTQRIYTNRDVTVAATLNGHLKVELKRHQEAPQGLSFTTNTTDPQLFSYELGDEVRINWKSPYQEVNEYRRLVGQDVTWRSGEETVVQYVEELSA